MQMPLNNQRVSKISTKLHNHSPIFKLDRNLSQSKLAKPIDPKLETMQLSGVSNFHKINMRDDKLNSKY